MKQSVSFIIVTCVAFFLGFMTHALFFPYIFIDGNTDAVTNEINRYKNVAPSSGPDSGNFVTYVEYDNGYFTPKEVTMIKGDYIAITNRSKTQGMKLDSDNQLLTTKRPYMESEQIRLVIPESGTFTVTERLQGKGSLIIHVK